jgi:hypothetical protein
MAVRSHSLPPGSCTIVTPGTAIRCTTLPGVGANYTFVVTVAGGSSAASSGSLSYAPPIINSVDGPGAVRGPAAGGVYIYLHGVCARGR